MSTAGDAGATDPETTIEPEAATPASGSVGDGSGCVIPADATFAGVAFAGVAATWTDFGRDRAYQRPAPANVVTKTTARPISSPRDNISRRSRMPDMDANVVRRPRPRRDRRHVSGHH